MESLANQIVELLNLQSINQGYDVIAYTFMGVILLLAGVSIFKTTPKDKEDVHLAETAEFKHLEEVVAEEEKKKEKPAPEVPTISWKERLVKGLERTRKDVWSKVGNILTGGDPDDEKYEQVEEILYTSDISPTLVAELLDHLKTKSKQIEQTEENYLKVIHDFLKGKMEGVQQKVSRDLYDVDASGKVLPKVIMIVGVNGAGKTTTIGKLATRLKSQGASVVVGACDTFRAAAVEQLQVWCERAGVEMVRALEGADPSGVAFDAVKRAKELGADYCIIDTAGRLHTKANLMDELTKTKKVMSKVISDAPHETLLVVDAITGQNAIRQAEEFNKALELTGLIFTKCDGSAKAGSAVGIVQKLEVPIVYIGVGEQVEDLNKFDLDDYLGALLGA